MLGLNGWCRLVSRHDVTACIQFNYTTTTFGRLRLGCILRSRCVGRCNNRPLSAFVGACLMSTRGGV